MRVTKFDPMKIVSGVLIVIAMSTGHINIFLGIILLSMMIDLTFNRN